MKITILRKDMSTAICNISYTYIAGMGHFIYLHCRNGAFHIPALQEWGNNPLYQSTFHNTQSMRWLIILKQTKNSVHAISCFCY